MTKMPDNRRPYDPAKAARERASQDNPAPVVGTAQQRWNDRSRLWAVTPRPAPAPATAPAQPVDAAPQPVTASASKDPSGS